MQATGYLILQSTSGVPQAKPFPNFRYEIGDVFDDGTVAYYGNELVNTITGLDAATKYYFSVHSFIEFGNSITYQLISDPITGSQITTALSPSSQPINLQFTNISGIQIDYSFDNGSSTGNLALFGIGNAITANPTSRVEYSVGDILGDSIVIASNSGSLTGLEFGTEYFFKIFSKNGADGYVNYLIDNPLTGSQQTLPDITPGYQPTNLQFLNVTSSSMDVSFTPATGAEGFLWLIKTSANPITANPEYLSSYNIGDTLGDAIVFSNNSTTAHSFTGLTDGLIYQHKIFSRNSTSYLLTNPLIGSQSAFNVFSFGKALHFDGTNDAVTASITNLLGGNNTASFMFWAKAHNTFGDRTIISSSDDLLSNGYYIAFQPDNAFLVRIHLNADIFEGGDSFAYFAQTASSITSQFNFYEVYFNGNGIGNANKIIMKKNNVQQSLSFVGNFPSSIGFSGKPLSIGAFLLNNLTGFVNFFNGELDCVAIYSDANQANGTTMWNNGLGAFPNQTNLLRYYTFDEADNSTDAIDSTGNNNAKLVNFNFNANSGRTIHT